LGQELLEGILIQAILDRFGVQVEYGTELLSIESSDDEVIAHLQRTAIDGTIHPETTKGKYLVGADGGRSRVRKELGLAFDGDALPGTMVVADIRVIGLEPTVSIPHIYPCLKLMEFFRLLTLGAIRSKGGTNGVLLPSSYHSHIESL
jgi:2-polyprenyl-6-methoxyphenol hydroxylase-like FAD-dependent oxidoreductase